MLGMTASGVRNLFMSGLSLMVVLQVHVQGTPNGSQPIRFMEDELTLKMNLS